jgi:hypothetical protein
MTEDWLSDPTMNLRSLLPCPFCGGGETRIDESHLKPMMDRPGALISVSVKHWCGGAGVMHAYREVRGRDHDSACREYNRRAAQGEEA